jgi:hypothetical protein
MAIGGVDEMFGFGQRVCGYDTGSARLEGGSDQRA